MRHRSGLLAPLAVAGPGLLAGLSDDDPAGITTYSILGRRHGYTLLWVLLLSTVAARRLPRAGPRRAGHRPGAIGLVRERYGVRAAPSACSRSSSPTRHDVRGVRRRRRGLELAGVRRGVSVPSPPWPSRRSSSAGSSAASSTCCSRSAPCSSPTSWRDSSRTPTGARPRAGLVVPTMPATRTRRSSRPPRRDDARAMGPRVHPVVRGRQAPRRRAT